MTKDEIDKLMPCYRAPPAADRLDELEMARAFFEAMKERHPRGFLPSAPRYLLTPLVTKWKK